MSEATAVHLESLFRFTLVGSGEAGRHVSEASMSSASSVTGSVDHQPSEGHRFLPVLIGYIPPWHLRKLFVRQGSAGCVDQLETAEYKVGMLGKT